MPITVELQDMFSYSFWIVAVAVIVVFVIGIIGLVVFMKNKHKKRPELAKQVSVQQPAPITGEQIKQKYFTLIDDLESQCRGGKVDSRRAYQKLSSILRRFVFELTGLKVHNYTLDEINRLNLPHLSEVIADCYAPEFSVDKQGDIYGTMNKARMVIKEWR